MTSPVNWAVLGLVIERPSYGFEIANRFERVYAETLSLSGASHIYSALDRLVDRGLAETMPGGGGRQPKLHYRATALGVASYEDWVVDRVADEQRRQELWVRQLGIFACDPGAALRLLERIQRQYLKDAGQIGRSSGPSAMASRPALIDDLVAERRRLEAGGTLSWFRYAQERFEALAQHSQVHESPRA
jgi:DNA-binding PadR family transcriptional regulator